jgi:hypothetical protein
LYDWAIRLGEWIMTKFSIIAVYKEDDNGVYVCIMVFTRAFLEEYDRELWLAELAQELAEGDLWAIRLVKYEALNDVEEVLSE